MVLWVWHWQPLWRMGFCFGDGGVVMAARAAADIKNGLVPMIFSTIVVALWLGRMIYDQDLIYSGLFGMRLRWRH